jgi:hypothetical protein
MSAAKKTSAEQAMIHDLSLLSPTQIQGLTKGESVLTYNCSTPEAVLDAAIHSKLKHFICIDSVTFEQQKKLANLSAKSYKKIISNPGILFTGDLGAKAKANLKFTYKICNRGDKQVVLELLREKLTELNVSGTLAVEVCLVADEIVSNAIFNAPFVPLDNHKSGIDRNGTLLKDNISELASFELHVNDTAIMISCVDGFGRLSIDAFLKRVRDCYNIGVSNKMNMVGNGGAGIGSHMIYHHSMGLYLAVSKEKASCVAATFPKNMSSRKREALAKSLHIIEVNEGES